MNDLNHKQNTQEIKSVVLMLSTLFIDFDGRGRHPIQFHCALFPIRKSCFSFRIIQKNLPKNVGDVFQISLSFLFNKNYLNFTFILI